MNLILSYSTCLRLFSGIYPQVSAQLLSKGQFGNHTRYVFGMFTIQYVSLCLRYTVSGLVYCLPENTAHNSEAQSKRQSGGGGVFAVGV